MKGLAKFGLTMMAAAVLAACGSSGGGGSDAPSASVNNAATNTNATDKETSGTANSGTSSNTGTVNSGTNRPVSRDDDMGEAVRISDGKDFDIAKSADYKTQLVVDGKTIPITLGPGISSGRFTSASGSTINGVRYDQFVVSGTRFSNLKFGVVNGYAFAQGDVTAKSAVPTAGTATYAVDGVLVKNGVPHTSTDTLLTADFGAKTLNGTVFNDNGNTVTIANARIEGNEFSGSAMHNGARAELDGHFYGPNAAELGGVYGSAGFSGAFGGKKQ